MRAALCGDAETARGARRWNDANVLALSLRTTSQALLGEILDAWFEGAPSEDESDARNVRHVDEILMLIPRPRVRGAVGLAIASSCLVVGGRCSTPRLSK